jgi:hypothetical protein
MANPGTLPKRMENAISLQTAVLCLDCECVSHAPHDQCPVCGSRSVSNLARILGGRILGQPAKSTVKGPPVLRFDVEIVIQVKQLQPIDLTDALETIARLISPYLSAGQASLHVQVEPPSEQSAQQSQAA